MNQLLGLIVSVFVLSVVATSTAQASPEDYGFRSETEMQNYLSITDVRVEEVAGDLSDVSQSHYDVVLKPGAALQMGNDLLSSLGPVLMDPSGVQAWIAFGKKAWEVVVANRPVVTMTSAPRVTVLPNDKTLWNQMANWRGPVAKSFSVAATNGFGVDVVKQTYTVTYNYGGSSNGKGAYLANATIIPANVAVMWGYTLNSDVSVGQILNTGSVANPVPGVDMQVKWTIKTILKESSNSENFFVQGNGALKHITRK